MRGGPWARRGEGPAGQHAAGGSLSQDGGSVGGRDEADGILREDGIPGSLLSPPPQDGPWKQGFPLPWCLRRSSWPLALLFSDFGAGREDILSPALFGWWS